MHFAILKIGLFQKENFGRKEGTGTSRWMIFKGRAICLTKTRAAKRSFCPFEKFSVKNDRTLKATAASNNWPSFITMTRFCRFDVDSFQCTQNILFPIIIWLELNVTVKIHLLRNRVFVAKSHISQMKSPKAFRYSIKAVVLLQQLYENTPLNGHL